MIHGNHTEKESNHAKCEMLAHQQESYSCVLIKDVDDCDGIS